MMPTQRSTSVPLDRYVGEAVLTLRHSRGWNRSQLARHSGCSRDSVRRVELANVISWPIVWKLSRGFGLTVSGFLTYAEQLAAHDRAKNKSKAA